MFHQFLKLIQSGKVHSLLEIARQMDISPAMVSQVAERLVKQGYLQAVGPGCDGSDQPCGDCAAGSACQPAPRRWVLTEKGKALRAGL